MLGGTERVVYIYVVDRDFGFAPNPFHGYCTLATCKPGIRKGAKIGDWVMGVGGGRLKATGRCVYLMKVTEKTTFDEYWKDSRFDVKKSLRNGSSVMMVGDNIYHKDVASGSWIQEDSHHSNADGSPNLTNLRRDTGSVDVLISSHFYYFGSVAPQIDLASIGYKNLRSYRKVPLMNDAMASLLANIEREYKKELNHVMGDPFDFSRAKERVDQSTGRIS